MLDEALARYLHELFGTSSDWAVIGGHAANLYRTETRATVDTDVLVAAAGRSMRTIADAMVQDGWSIRSMPNGDWLVRVKHPLLGAVDIIAAETEYQSTALSRARLTRFGGVPLRALAVEDVLIHKMIAGRFKDEADVEDILRADPDMDEDYLKHWLTEWEIQDRFARVAGRL
ncbi:MAG: hypothetical protein F4Y86_07195 [Gammaproteobacteria bacterium]|nr:hypothetical protein [Gammaproteobacteria bacterium]MXY52296.1 hypothetical protein [Gammaproteobacteria bacterium]MYB39022.1 hypothetical protein [Gammaproteobacteria bacterium]